MSGDASMSGRTASTTIRQRKRSAMGKPSRPPLCEKQLDGFPPRGHPSEHDAVLLGPADVEHGRRPARPARGVQLSTLKDEVGGGLHGSKITVRTIGVAHDARG